MCTCACSKNLYKAICAQWEFLVGLYVLRCVSTSTAAGSDPNGHCEGNHLRLILPSRTNRRRQPTTPQKPPPHLLFSSDGWHVVADMRTSTRLSIFCLRGSKKRGEKLRERKKNISPSFHECFDQFWELVSTALTLIRSEAVKLCSVTMRGTDRTLCIYRLFAHFVSGHIDIHRRVCTSVFVCFAPVSVDSVKKSLGS